MSLVFKKKKFNAFVNTDYTFAKNSPKNQLGFTIPIVVLFVLAFMIIPLGFWYSGAHKVSAGDVQGIESTETKTGTHLLVISSSGAWDMFEYLCKNKDECEKNLSSGKKLESVSGGKTLGSTVTLNYMDSWKDYEFLKVYAKQGWGSSGISNFEINKKIQDGYGEIIQVEKQNVLLIPIKEIESGNYGLFEIKSSL